MAAAASIRLVLRMWAGGPLLRIEAFDAIERESPLSVTLVQAWVATDKLDWIVEKAVELGVARVVLMPATRSVVRLDAERRAKRLAHLRQLAVSACAQCGRNRVPTVAAASDMAQALADLAGERFILRPDAVSALGAPHVPGHAATVMVGPEGGFDDAEVRAAEQLGCRSMRLGPRVLRTETAGLAALAVLQATAGDLGRLIEWHRSASHPQCGVWRALLTDRTAQWRR
jgi:16S rRNA (uracil1498-N3)-methyltransferase